MLRSTNISYPDIKPDIVSGYDRTCPSVDTAYSGNPAIRAQFIFPSKVYNTIPPVPCQVFCESQILRQPREIPKYGTYLPLGPYRTGGLLPPLWGTPMCMVPMDLHKRRKGEEAGLLWLGLAARRVKARPSGATGRHPAGVTARRLVTKVKTPYFQ